ncbi:MAG: hypothetical protein WCP29_04370 [Acidobacteriota bacterium]
MGTVSGITLTYGNATFSIVNGKVTFPDCTVYIATTSGMLIGAGTASGCTPVGSSSSSSTSSSGSTSGSSSGTTTSSLGPSNGGPSSGTLSGTILTYNGTTYTVNALGLVQLPDCRVYMVAGNGALTYQRNAATCAAAGGSGSAPTGTGPSNGGPSSGTLNGTILTYNGATFTINSASQVQLPDCKVYLVIANGLYLVYQRDANSCNVPTGSANGGAGSTSVPGTGPLQTWSAPKKVVDIGRVSIYGIEMAFDTLTQRYLIVYRASFSGCGGVDAIWGQFLNVAADPLGTPFLVSVGKDCVWNYSGWEPAVAATGDGRFIVTYAANAGGGWNAMFNLAEYNGGPQLTPAAVVDTGTSHESTSVVWMPHAKQFMVMWSKNGPPRGVKNIYSRTLTRDGTPSQIYKVNDNPDFIDLAQVRMVQGGDNNVQVLAWRDSTNAVMAPNGGISYTQVDETGAPRINTGNVVGPSSSFYRYPRMAYNSQTQKYFAIYTDYGYPGCDGQASGGDIMSRSFNLDGSPVEPWSNVFLATDRCNGAVPDDQFTELGLAYEPVNNAFVVGSRGQDGGGGLLPVYHMVTDPSGGLYRGSITQQPTLTGGGSPMPTFVPDGTGKVTMAYRGDYLSIWISILSK